MVSPNELDALLTVLAEHRVTAYRCEEFAVEFAGPLQAPPRVEKLSQTGVVNRDVNGGLTETEKRFPSYTTAFGGQLPAFKPAREPAKE